VNGAVLGIEAAPEYDIAEMLMLAYELIRRERQSCSG
jgi:hypothetical protein